ncbi:MAG TPA: hypothetical protein PKU78_05410 [Candidatus Dojkabacteria bacterium]|nr:hypothetical protein [Candidatus Dojkabacteria bacterium]
MKATLIEHKPAPITGNRLNEFPENVWGVIREWPTNYIGTIVIRRGNTLFSMEKVLDSPNSHHWSNWHELIEFEGDYYIEPLPPGTKIEITL